MLEKSLKRPRATPIGQPQQKPNLQVGEQVAEFLDEQFGFIRLYAEIAQRYVSSGDLAGLNHAMRHVIARTKVAAAVLNGIAANARADEANDE